MKIYLDSIILLKHNTNITFFEFNIVCSTKTFFSLFFNKLNQTCILAVCHEDLRLVIHGAKFLNNAAWALSHRPVYLQPQEFQWFDGSFCQMKRWKASEVTLRAALEMKFLCSLCWDMLKNTCLCSRQNYVIHSFTQKRVLDRALHSFFPLLALTFSVGRTSTSFGFNLFIFYFLLQHLIKECWLTFIIVYSYIWQRKCSTFNPFFFISIICDLNFVNRNPFIRAFSLSNSRSWCHVLQEKIIVCFSYSFTPFNF